MVTVYNHPQQLPSASSMDFINPCISLFAIHAIESHHCSAYLPMAIIP